MTRIEQGLIAAIILSTIASAVLIGRRLMQPAPLLPNLNVIDPISGADLREFHRDFTASAARGEASASRWMELGDVYGSFGFFPEAEVCYRQAYAMDAALPEIHYRWAICLERMGRTSEATQHFREALKNAVATRATECWYKIGLDYLREEKLTEAEAAFDRIAEYPPARYQRAKLMSRTGREAQAVTLLDELIRQFPNVVEPVLLRGRIEQTRGNAAAAWQFRGLAERATNKLIENYRFDVYVVNRDRYGWDRQYGELQKHRQNLPELARSARRLRDRDWTTRINLLLIQTDLDRGRPQEALPSIEKEIERTGAVPETLMLLGQTYVQLGQEDKAVQQWQRLSRMRDDNLNDLNLSTYFQKQGNLEVAGEYMARAYQDEGLIQFRSNQPQAASGLFANAVQLNPKTSRSWFYLGECHRLLGNLDQARSHYRKCVEIDPHNGRAIEALRHLPISVH